MLLLAVVAGAQNLNVLDQLKADPRRAYGNDYPYHFTDKQLTKAPEGYKPFYISHYSRHGSRYFWSADSADRSFTAGTSSGGNVYDTYQDVLDMTTTLTRLEMAYRDAVDPLIDAHFIDENEFGYPTIFFGNEDIDRSGLTYDMTADPKHMPVPTCVVLSLKTDATQSLRRTQSLAVRLAMEGYQVDYWSYSDQEGHYFEIIPTERLLTASSPDDLKEFQLQDDMK